MGISTNEASKLLFKASRLSKHIVLQNNTDIEYILNEIEFKFLGGRIIEVILIHR